MFLNLESLVMEYDNKGKIPNDEIECKWGKVNVDSRYGNFQITQSPIFYTYISTIDNHF